MIASRQLFAASLVVLVGCSGSKQDQAAKARIFSPEEAAIDVRRAAEPLKVADATTDAALWDRLWRMDRLEVTHRIGAHTSHGTAHFKWTRGLRAVELNEDQTFETSADGQFHATVTNDQDSGFEYIWANSHAYARGRYGPFHPRRSDRAQQDAFRDQAASALRTVFGLMHRKLHASAGGRDKSTKAHPTASRFVLAMGSAWGPEEPARKDKPVFGQVLGKEGLLHPGPDEDTARRLELDTHVEPEKVSGDLLVDPSGVIVQATVHAKFKVPEPSGNEVAVLELDVTYDLSPSNSIEIAEPKDVLAQKLPHAVNDPLWFTRTVGQTATQPEPEEVVDETDEATPAPKTTKDAAPAKAGQKK